MATQQEYELMSAAEKKKEDWMNSKWRPMMGWVYMATCVTDFVLFPVLWSLVQAITKQPITQWQPLTLQGAGLFHVAMGAVLGLAAWGRTQEKLNGANNGGLQTTSTLPNAGFSSGFTAPSAPATGGFGAPSSSFGSAPLGGNSASRFGGGGVGSTPAAPATSFGGNTNFGASEIVPASSTISTEVTPAVSTPAFGSAAPVVTSSSGKAAPVQPDFPER
jgi:hypothetical protein